MISQFRERIVGMHYLNQWIVLILDTVASVLCTFLACILAGHLVPGTMGMSAVLKITLLAVPASGLSFYLFRIYRNIIRHSTLRELWRLVAASAVKLLLMAVVVFGMMLTDRQLLIGGLLDMLMTTVVLICMRVGMVLGYDVIVSKISKSNSRLLIYGVDDRSVSLETRMRNSKQYQIAGFYNYGKAYKSYRLADLPVYYFNDEQDFVHIVTRYNIEGILFPDYESIRTEKERLIRYCEMHHVRMLIAPPVDEVSGDKLVPGIREIKIEDLLGRDEINMEEEEVAAGFRDRTVLVTGAAGSIGSELCRQLASFGVGRLILFDSAETPMHNIRLELEERFPHLSFVPVIGDVRLKARVRMIFERHRPDVVFHAAAYKHVPLMEENPCEAVFVNAIGTQHVADLCVEYGVEKMVMISTDKAVNPTNVMGASKRLAEICAEPRRVDSGRAYGGSYPLRHHPFRQRAGQQRQRHTAIHGADKARRPGHGDASGDNAFLHDHTRGVPSGDGSGHHKRRQRDNGVRNGRVHQDSRPCQAHDRTGRLCTGSGYRNTLYRVAAGRETLRGGSEQYGEYHPHFPQED